MARSRKTTKPASTSATAKRPRKPAVQATGRSQRYPIRVFISYSHENRVTANAVKAHLKKIGAIPISDHEIRVGEAFSSEIRQMIECAHVFLPILTKESNRRLWVHQEIGYALGLHVPVIPIALGQLPSGMAEHIQAVHLAPDGSDLAEKLKYELFADGLTRSKGLDLPAGRFECAFELYDRQSLLAQYTKQAGDNCRKKYRGAQISRRSHLSSACRIRQCTAFSSFSIPDKNIGFPVWDERDGKGKRSRSERRLLRRERQLMERHARRYGCDLILDPYVRVQESVTVSAGKAAGGTSGQKVALKHNHRATRLRLELILEFLESMTDSSVNVAIPNPDNRGLIQKNLVIVGDWFSAEAVVPYYLSGGYQQTIFTHHGPTVLRETEDFDQDFDDILAENGIRRRDSRRAAIKMIKEELKKLKIS